MAYSLKQAAAACGRSKSSVYDALKSGKLKHELDEKGRFVIQPGDLNSVFPERLENVQAEQEKTPLNDEKNSLLLQTIESLEKTVAALEGERNEWREQAKTSAATIENQAAALAGMAAASARAIAQAEEMRHQLAAIEHVKSEPKADPTSEPEAAPVVRSPFWFALVAAAALAGWYYWPL